MPANSVEAAAAQPEAVLTGARAPQSLQAEDAVWKAGP